MAFLIGGANSLADTGYDIDNSCRFDDGSSSTLEINLAESANASRRTFTWSAWVKRGNITGAVQTLYSTGSGDDDFDSLSFDANDNLRIFCRNAGSTSATLITNAKYRDVSAWYHIVMRIDTTQGTEANRLRLYVNGEEPSLGTATYTTQNKNLLFNTTFDNSFIGCQTTDSESLFFDGYIAEIHNVSAASLGPGSFGETNDNGVWIPKDCKDDLTYGTNGYYLEFKGTGTSADSSGIGADTSGNDQHFSLNNIAATDVTTDTPTNNFCTGNPLDVSGVDNPGDVCTFSEGNTKIVQAGSNNVVGWKASTIGIRNGKWYFELKLPIIDYQVFGVGASTWDGQDGAADNQFSVYIDNGTETFRRGAGVAAAALSVTSSNNDIWMFALDLDSPKLWIGHQGTWLASGDPAAGSNPMSTQAITDTIFIGGSLYTQNDSQILLNTGNPSYANSSSQADDNGYGDFEYDVPAGFYSICTKNLAQFG